MWDSSAHVGLQCSCGTLVHVWGASASRVACWFSFCSCGTPVPMWGSSAHVGLQCPCGTLVHVWGASASRVACWFSFTNFRRAKVPMGLYYKIKLPLWCTCGVPVPVWGSSAHVGHWCTCGVPRLHMWRAGSVLPILEELKFQWVCNTKLNYHFGARVGCQCPCGAPVPMWDTGARVGCLGFTCGVLVQFYQF